LIATISEMMVYLLPILGILAGVNLVLTWLMSLTVGLGRRTFKG